MDFYFFHSVAVNTISALGPLPCVSLTLHPIKCGHPKYSMPILQQPYRPT